MKEEKAQVSKYDNRIYNTDFLWWNKKEIASAWMQNRKRIFLKKK